MQVPVKVSVTNWVDGEWKFLPLFVKFYMQRVLFLMKELLWSFKS